MGFGGAGGPANGPEAVLTSYTGPGRAGIAAGVDWCVAAADSAGCLICT